jgi:hypothetical protein
MPDAFVIRIKHGGLGDHLFYSHLPRIAKEHCGFKRVLISNLSEYRHQDYKRLVWEANPFVDGFTDEDAPFPGFSSVPEGTNLLDHIMILRGLDDGKRFHEPELHLKPERITHLTGATIYDPNFVSDVGDLRSFHVERFFARKRIVPDFMLKPRAKGVPVGKYGAILETNDLEHYCAVIASAKRFYCLTSGGATLAAALRVPVTALWGPGQWLMFHHSPLHTYVNVNPVTFRQKCRQRINRFAQALQRRSRNLAKRCLNA